VDSGPLPYHGANSTHSDLAWSHYQQAIYDVVCKDAGHGVVDAVPGSGKTTTLVQACNRVDPDVPAHFFAFNRHIARELQSRLPAHVGASTIHSLGHRTLGLAGYGRQVDDKKYARLCAAFLAERYPAASREELRRIADVLLGLVGMARLTLTDPSSPDALRRMALAYELDMGDAGTWERATENLVAVLECGRRLARGAVDVGRVVQELTDDIPYVSPLPRPSASGVVDYTDMIWLPIVEDLQPRQTDWVMIDESQDLNRCGLELGRRDTHVMARVPRATARPAARCAGYGPASGGVRHKPQRPHYWSARRRQAMTYTVVEGVVEEAQPRQVGPGNAPGPLEPTVVPLVEAAREMRKELRERYPSVKLSVRTNRAWYPSINIEWLDGPSREEVQAVADNYRGYRHVVPNPLDDYSSYEELPGRWVGGQFIRYDVAYVHVHRSESANQWTRAQCVEFAEEVMALQQESSRYHAPKTTTHLNVAMLLLGLSEREVVKLLKSGEIAATKARGRWEIDIASLRAYAAGRKEGEP
jgi:hypothetical protein